MCSKYEPSIVLSLYRLEEFLQLDLVLVRKDLNQISHKKRKKYNFIGKEPKYLLFKSIYLIRSILNQLILLNLFMNKTSISKLGKHVVKQLYISVQ